MNDEQTGTSQYDDDSIDWAAEAEAEAYAEFGMSWVAGGGRAYDVRAAWAQHKAMADGTWFESSPYPTYGGEDWDERELIDWEMSID